MKLVPAGRPVTIHRVRYGERWFPYVFRHTDGSLLLYIQYGHDANFSPALRLRSADNGRTWGEPVDNIPRQCWSHSFADGELFEIDTYGVQDPKSPETAVYWGAWSHPERTDDALRRNFVRVHAPSIKPTPLAALLQGYPAHHWWPIWNKLWGREDMTAQEIQLSGPVFTSGVGLAGDRVLAVAYETDRQSAAGKSCVVALESSDRGRTWEEIAVAARDDTTPEGPDEATLVQLKDGRLYCAMRTGEVLYHIWSGDEGRTWTKPEPMRLIDEDRRPGWVWPVAKVLDDGTLVMIYGRPGKDLIFDPTGTGTQWQGRLDLTAWERETQAMLGVPEEQRIRRPYPGLRHWDSSDYLALVTDGPRQLIAVYDTQHYVEHWNAKPASAVRMVRVRVED